MLPNWVSRITSSDFNDGKASDSFVGNLSKFFLTLTSMLQHGLTFKDNFNCALITTELTDGIITTITNPLKTTPIGIIALNCPVGFYVIGAPTVHQNSVDPGSIDIYIGLNTTDTIDVTLLLVGG